jgi:hypothetical protein
MKCSFFWGGSRLEVRSGRVSASLDLGEGLQVVSGISLGELVDTLSGGSLPRCEQREGLVAVGIEKVGREVWMPHRGAVFTGGVGMDLGGASPKQEGRNVSELVAGGLQGVAGPIPGLGSSFLAAAQSDFPGSGVLGVSGLGGVDVMRVRDGICQVWWSGWLNVWRLVSAFRGVRRLVRAEGGGVE